MRNYRRMLSPHLSVVVNTPYALVDVTVCNFLRMCLVGMKRLYPRWYEKNLALDLDSDSVFVLITIVVPFSFRSCSWFLSLPAFGTNPDFVLCPIFASVSDSALSSPSGSTLESRTGRRAGLKSVLIQNFFS
ncbi:hypothetical protein EVAR_65902_1 [Eumeta japonica]|uniref:Uncharacterized protein n=1 Tax=Eumeta variegata TaxID=151549 RepID=A0A4C1ZVS9_EUMVA|nr:hypothetical protein EVAR_65902_1 [Eumeta japonica]